jgi:hypothetical protein
MAGLWADFRPQRAVEEMLVERIAICYWRLRRCLRAERGEIRKALDTCKLTWEQERFDALSYAKIFPAQALDTEKLENLARYEIFLDRKLERTLSILLKLQATRANP